LQLWDAISNGYWHARSQVFLNESLMKTIEWIRLPGDIIFAALGVIPLVIAAGLAYLDLRKQPVT